MILKRATRSSYEDWGFAQRAAENELRQWYAARVELPERRATGAELAGCNMPPSELDAGTLEEWESLRGGLGERLMGEGWTEADLRSLLHFNDEELDQAAVRPRRVRKG